MRRSEENHRASKPMICSESCGWQVRFLCSTDHSAPESTGSSPDSIPTPDVVDRTLRAVGVALSVGLLLYVGVSAADAARVVLREFGQLPLGQKAVAIAFAWLWLSIGTVPLWVGLIRRAR